LLREELAEFTAAIGGVWQNSNDVAGVPKATRRLRMQVTVMAPAFTGNAMHISSDISWLRGLFDDEISGVPIVHLQMSEL
jgi:hypothetical protein